MKKTNILTDFALDTFDFSILNDVPDIAFANKFIAMALEPGKLHRNFIKQEQLHHFVEGRFLIVTGGSARLEINLEAYSLEKGDIILAMPDTIIEIKSTSDDFNIMGMMFREDVPVPRMAHVKPSAGELELMKRMIRMTWDIAHIEPFRRETVRNMTTAMVSNILEMQEKTDTGLHSEHLSRQEQLFRRFKKLVSRHCIKERSIAFYADSLYISPHYLSGIVSKVSGKPVMYWINHAVILQAKIMLKENNAMIYEVADRLNFPNQSFFGRFFKRETGMTPGEYQSKMG